MEIKFHRSIGMVWGGGEIPNDDMPALQHISVLHMTMSFQGHYPSIFGLEVWYCASSNLDIPSAIARRTALTSARIKVHTPQQPMGNFLHHPTLLCSTKVHFQNLTLYFGYNTIKPPRMVCVCVCVCVTCRRGIKNPN